jgi:hypothetical protein
MWFDRERKAGAAKFAVADLFQARHYVLQLFPLPLLEFLAYGQRDQLQLLFLGRVRERHSEGRWSVSPN